MFWHCVPFSKVFHIPERVPSIFLKVFRLLVSASFSSIYEQFQCIDTAFVLFLKHEPLHVMSVFLSVDVGSDPALDERYLCCQRYIEDQRVPHSGFSRHYATFCLFKKNRKDTFGFLAERSHIATIAGPLGIFSTAVTYRGKNFEKLLSHII